MFNISNTKICVLMLYTYQTATARKSEFSPYHPQLDPKPILGNYFQNKCMAPAPTTITASTDVPITISAARRYPDASAWASAHTNEIDQLENQNSITWLHTCDKPPNCQPINLTILYRNKREASVC